MLTMVLPSHASDVDIESCWRWRCRGDVDRGVMLLSSHTSDSVAEVS
jgi:hypothetical protein